MDGNHLGMQIALFLLLAVGVALVAVILTLVVVFVVSIAPGLTTLISRLSRRAKRLKEGSYEFGELRRDGSSKP